jgi:protein YIPF5/7
MAQLSWPSSTQSSTSLLPSPTGILLPSSSSLSSSISSSSSSISPLDLEDYTSEPPLLEELGISFTHVSTKLKAVMLLHKPVPLNILQDSDMAGPLVVSAGLAFFLLLQGKLVLGYIYGFGMMGTLALFTLLSLMQKKEVPPIDLSRTFSVMGYSLLPIVTLAAFNVLVQIKIMSLGIFLAGLAILWSTIAATRIFEAALVMTEQRYLIAYPVLLFYACFALMAIF